jgi:BolA family transcriptional regulator, general stress-responsive regulator
VQINIEAITRALKSHLDESAVLSVIDESEQHRGHKGHNPEVGVTHIALNLVWEAFEGLTLIERHRLANSWLDGFFKQGLHAVRYCLKTPNEEAIL